MSEEILDALVSLVGVAGGILGGGALVAWIQRRKTNAEAGKVSAEAGNVVLSGKLEILDRTMEWNRELLKRIEGVEENFKQQAKRETELIHRIDALEREVDKLEGENRALRSRCKKLETEVGELEEENRKLRHG